MGEAKRKREAAAAQQAAGNSGLLNLAVDPGGREVDMSLVQITDQEVFGKFTEHQMAVVADLVQRKQRPDPKKLDSRGWAREDGSLLIRGSGAKPFEVVVSAGGWRELTPAEKTTLEREAQRRMALGGDELLRDMASVVKQTAQHQQRSDEAFAAVAGKAQSVVSVFGRHSQSLQALYATKAVGPAQADEWLASDAQFLLVWKSRSGQGSVARVTGPVEVFEALEGALVLGGTPAATLLMPCTHTDLDAEMGAWWRKHGGLVAVGASPGTDLH